MVDLEELYHEGWGGFKARISRKWKRLKSKKSLSFLSIHYIYLIGMSFLGSIICVAPGGLQYIDALFFSVGAATQSGLNTVDVNLLNYTQQITLYMIGNLTNPIIINTFVVFVRLYWFEKRFQHVVKEAMSLRRTKSRGQTAEKEDKDTEKQSQGVRGRRITLVSDSGRVIHGDNLRKDEPESSGSSEQETYDPFPRLSEEDHAPPVHRNITFPENLVSPTGKQIPEDRMPGERNAEHHIAFLEKQRNDSDGEVLRIPGPRESDRGKNPEAVKRELSNEEGRHIKVDASNTASRYRARTNTGGTVFRKSATDRSNASATGLERRNFARSRKNTGLSAMSFKSIFTRQDTTSSKMSVAPYLSWQPTIGRNSAFIDLTEEQREELGGIEYRSLKTLAFILLAYFFGWHAIGVINFLPWILETQPWRGIVEGVGQSPIWWGFFTPATLFNDVGFTLTPDSFISFQGAVWPLIFGGFLIVIGNTGFPCLLRFLIWLTSVVVPKDTALWEELRFLLDHPRRCFTLLFPASATWVLFAVLIILNGLDLLFFIILDLNDATVDSIPPGLRFLAGLFQAFSTRTAGTTVVNLSGLHPAIQVSYLVMMYISVFPIAISVRRTNVYEERSLGIYAPAHEDDDDENMEHDQSYIGRHLSKQLKFDLWFIFLGFFIITIAEGGPIVNDPGFSMFAILFEIVSAYGTVGLSLGYPGINASLSAEFSVISKLVITAMMMRGRHRGLPYQLDRAILLPSESLHEKEDADAARRHRRGSNFSEMGSRGPTVDGMFDPAMNSLIERGHQRRYSRAHSEALSPTDLRGHPRQMMGNALAQVVRATSRT